MSSLLFPFQPQVFTKSKEGIYRQLLLDFSGSINYSTGFALSCELRVMNSLKSDAISGDVRIQFGGITFFEGGVQKSYYSTEDLTTNSLTLTLNPVLIVAADFLSKSTFPKGTLLSSIIPTISSYSLKNEYTFPNANPKQKTDSQWEILKSRANIISEKEDLGEISIDRFGNFVFQKISTPKIVKSSLHIMQQKVLQGDMISLDILPNINVYPQVQFNLRENYKPFYQKTSLIPYIVTSTGISFNSRQGAIQKVQAVSKKYFEGERNSV